MQLWKGETVRKTDVTWAVIPTRDNSPMSEGGTGNGHSNDVRGLAFNGLGTLCASCGADNKIVVWAAKTASAVISISKIESETMQPSSTFQPSDQ